MPHTLPPDLIDGLRSGAIVPYLGAGALAGAVDKQTGSPIPADSDSLILAMNDGKPMAPRLMYEFPRAAMNLELKRGRSFVNRFLTKLYGDTEWTRAPMHDWLAALRPPWVVDINRDTQLQDSYADAPHTLVTGCARLGGTDYRFRIHEWDGTACREIAQEDANLALPVLFKPMGTPRPRADFIASDADYVDYITELMGGFAIPSFLKERRKGKRYLFLGLRLTRDTERMVMSDIVHDHGAPTGWALIEQPTSKEERFCTRMGIRIVRAGIEALPGI